MGSEARNGDAAVRPLAAEDRAAVTATAARAFTIDPLFGYFTRDRLHAHRALPGLLSGVVHDLVGHGVSWVAESSDGVVGIAGWGALGGRSREVPDGRSPSPPGARRPPSGWPTRCTGSGCWSGSNGCTPTSRTGTWDC